MNGFQNLVSDSNRNEGHQSIRSDDTSDATHPTSPVTRGCLRHTKPATPGKYVGEANAAVILEVAKAIGAYLELSDVLGALITTLKPIVEFGAVGIVVRDGEYAKLHSFCTEGAQQEKEFERVGGNRTLRTDVRVIAATNRDLHQEVCNGRFRMDLYYRLNVFPVHMPPLRERPGDIPILIDYFAARLSGCMGKRIRQIEKRTLDAMQQYSWPGNIRELQNVIERGVILAEGEVFRLEHGALQSGPSQTLLPFARVPIGLAASAGCSKTERVNAI
jgi:transcriptional regulator with GAF, ATPase, and Fis domain